MNLVEIRAQLEQDHPVLTEQINGQVRTLTEAERATTLDRWAEGRWAAHQQEAAAEKLATAKAATYALR